MLAHLHTQLASCLPTSSSTHRISGGKPSNHQHGHRTVESDGRVHVRILSTSESGIPGTSISDIVLISGGLEMLFSDQRKHRIIVPAAQPDNKSPADVGYLIQWLCQNLMKDPRKELFVLDDSVLACPLPFPFAPTPLSTWGDPIHGRFLEWNYLTDGVEYI